MIHLFCFSTDLIFQNGRFSFWEWEKGYAEFNRARWPRLFTMAPQDDADAGLHDLASELKLLVALSVCTLVCVFYICCNFI
jgi:hypothetical protein